MGIQCDLQCISTHTFADIKLLPPFQPHPVFCLCDESRVSANYISLLPAGFLLGSASQRVQEAHWQAEGGKRDTLLPVCFLFLVMVP